jgi:hypothetical protein
MFGRNLIVSGSVLGIALIFSGAVQAVTNGLCSCAHCGRSSACQKTCRLVCEEKKVEVIHFGCQCEHFCIGGPSKPGCQHCECLPGSSDANCDCTSPIAAPKKFLWTEWIPGGASVFTKKKLMRKTETVTVKSYKWVVEDVCQQCDLVTTGADITPGVDIPAPPIAGARLKFGTIEQPLLTQ